MKMMRGVMVREVVEAHNGEEQSAMEARYAERGGAKEERLENRQAYAVRTK